MGSPSTLFPQWPSVDNGHMCLHMSTMEAAASFDSSLEHKRLRYFPSSGQHTPPRPLATTTPVRPKHAIQVVTPLPRVSINIRQLL